MSKTTKEQKQKTNEKAREPATVIVLVCIINPSFFVLYFVRVLYIFSCRFPCSILPIARNSAITFSFFFCLPPFRFIEGHFFFNPLYTKCCVITDIKRSLDWCFDDFDDWCFVARIRVSGLTGRKILKSVK